MTGPLPRPVGRGCDVPGCKGAHLSGGLCQKHYSRKRAGRPLTDEAPEVGSPSGVGAYGVLDDDGETVMCHECGYRATCLASHVYNAHGMRARQYKLKHGLPLSKGLASAAWSAASSAASRARVDTPAWRRLEAARDPLAASQARGDDAFRSPAVRRHAAAHAEKRNRAVVAAGPATVACRRCGVDVPRTIGRDDPTYCRPCMEEARAESAARARAARHAANATRDAAILALWDQGETKAAIGRRYGITGARVGQIIRRRPAGLQDDGMPPTSE